MSPSMTRFTVFCAIFGGCLSYVFTQSQQSTTQSSNLCSLSVVPGGSNGLNVAAGGRTIMEDEPCRGFGPQTDSFENSRRREGCRKAAEALARQGTKPDCGRVVHGQCAQAVATGNDSQSLGNQGAACYVLAKLSDGSFTMRLLKDCADGGSSNSGSTSTGTASANGV